MLSLGRWLGVPRRWSQQWSSEKDAYQHLHQYDSSSSEDQEVFPPFGRSHGPPSRLRRLILYSMLAAFSFTVVGCLVDYFLLKQFLNPITTELPTSQILQQILHPLRTDTPEVNLPASQRPFHLILPASNTDVNLCKVLLTGSILGYPTPTLINWELGQDSKDGKLSHLAKITGVIDYLASFKAEQQNDLVLMMDGYDTWFQLPLATLMERYDRLSQEASERLAEEMGGIEVMREAESRQEVIFSSDKACFLLEGPWCYMQPESPLPKDMYGNLTDIGGHDSKKTKYWQYNRPRYLNSGFIMGPASQIRGIFERAREYTPSKQMFQSDQRIFEMVFAEQSIYRDIARRKADPKLTDDLPDYEDLPTNASYDLRQAAERKRLVLRPGRKYDFGMYIDYAASLSHPTGSATNDSKWLKYNTTDATPELFTFPVTGCQPAIAPLPSDITATGNPFAALNESDPDHAKSWNDIDLYTDICTGSIPVVIHHNGNKLVRYWDWPKLWLQKRAKDLLGAQKLARDSHLHSFKSMDNSLMKLTGVRADASKFTEEAWRGAAQVNTGGAVGDGGEVLSWESMCLNREWEEELWRDEP